MEAYIINIKFKSRKTKTFCTFNIDLTTSNDCDHFLKILCLFSCS